MSDKNRVLWTDGLFLQANHFQQQERYFEHQLHTAHKTLAPFYQGLSTLEICQTSLSQGVFRLNAIAGCLSDGCFFNAPHHADLPSHLNLTAEHVGKTVYLSLSTPGAFGDQLQLESDTKEQKRYVAKSIETRNVFEAESNIEALEVAQENLQLHVANHAPEGFSVLKIAKINEVDSLGQVHLDTHFEPARIVINDSNFLNTILRDIINLIDQKLQQNYQRAMQATQKASQFNDFMLMQACQRHRGLIEHLAHHSAHHPEKMYLALIALLGDLEFLAGPNKTKRQPQYQHFDLFTTFTRLFENISQILSISTEQFAVQIELQAQSPIKRVAHVRDRSLLTQSRLILCVRANLPSATLVKHVLSTIKIGSDFQLEHIIKYNLPGVGLAPLTQCPSELPAYNDFVYLELQIKGYEQWEQVVQSQTLAIYCPENLPGFEAELWAIKLARGNV